MFALPVEFQYFILMFLSPDIRATDIIDGELTHKYHCVHSVMNCHRHCVNWTTHNSQKASSLSHICVSNGSGPWVLLCLYRRLPAVSSEILLQSVTTAHCPLSLDNQLPMHSGPDGMHNTNQTYINLWGLCNEGWSFLAQRLP